MGALSADHAAGKYREASKTGVVFFLAPTQKGRGGVDLDQPPRPCAFSESKEPEFVVSYS
jgi:hypothetical protein